MITRRNLIKALSLGAGAAFWPDKALAADQSSQFSYCLNTSTIMGQNLGLKASIEIAARAGYDGVELWIRDIQEYVQSGNSINRLRIVIKDAGLKLENAIGFAPCLVADNDKRKAGVRQMEQEMGLLADLDCQRVAAPAAGVDREMDLFKAGQWYRDLLDLGRKTGVMPQLEFWGAFPFFHHLGQALMVAAVADDPDARILPDVYHLFRGGSGFGGLKMLNGDLIEVFHMNDYVGTIPREEQEDKDRVYPGDGIAPMQQIVGDLKKIGGAKVLSLELFNQDYWKEGAYLVAKKGLEKIKRLTGE